MCISISKRLSWLCVGWAFECSGSETVTWKHDSLWLWGHMAEPTMQCLFFHTIPLPLSAKTQEGHSHGSHMGVTNPIKATCEFHPDFVVGIYYIKFHKNEKKNLQFFWVYSSCREQKTKCAANFMKNMLLKEASKAWSFSVNYWVLWAVKIGRCVFAAHSWMSVYACSFLAISKIKWIKWLTWSLVLHIY